jgi:hypothetical protein
MSLRDRGRLTLRNVPLFFFCTLVQHWELLLFIRPRAHVNQKSYHMASRPPNESMNWLLRISRILAGGRRVAFIEEQPIRGPKQQQHNSVGTAHWELGPGRKLAQHHSSCSGGVGRNQRLCSLEEFIFGFGDGAC